MAGFESVDMWYRSGRVLYEEIQVVFFVVSVIEFVYRRVGNLLGFRMHPM